MFKLSERLKEKINAFLQGFCFNKEQAACAGIDISTKADCASGCALGCTGGCYGCTGCKGGCEGCSGFASD